MNGLFYLLILADRECVFKKVLQSIISDHIAFRLERKVKRTGYLNQYQHDDESEELSLVLIIECTIAFIYCCFPEVFTKKIDILTAIIHLLIAKLLELLT